jgi:hypothetical protein
MLIALLLAVAEVSAEQPAVARERTVSVWVQPLGFTVAPIAVAIAADAAVYLSLPLGMNLVFGTTELALETTVYGFVSGSGRSSFAGGSASLGPVLHTGDKPLNGWVLIPKLGVEVMHEFSRNVTGVSLLPGIDFGWQHTFGPFYFGLIAGISAGWSFADGDSFAGPGLNPTLPTKPQPVFGVNFNLLRMGGAF